MRPWCTSQSTAALPRWQPRVEVVLYQLYWTQSERRDEGNDFFIVFLAIRGSFPIFACTNQISLSCFWQFVIPSPSSRAPIRFLYRVSGNSWFLPHLRVHQSDFFIVFLAIRGSFPIFACTNQRHFPAAKYCAHPRGSYEQSLTPRRCGGVYRISHA
jgi:hypothetical protein